VRSHAKASTAGSTKRQVTGLLLPTGVFAAILALVIVAGSASAANGVVNFFGGGGVTGGKFGDSNGGPGGVAVNQEGTGGAAAGDVYVVDRGHNRIQQFSAAGSFIRAFGLDVGGAGVNVCEVAASCVAGTASAEAAGLNNPQGIAIDQTNGNVYVTDQGNGRVDVFSAEGDFQAAFGWGVDTGAPELELCTTASTCAAGSAGVGAGQFGEQIGYPAVAPAGSPNAGDLYVASSSNRRVDQFEPTLTAGEVTGIAFVKAWGWGVDTGAAEFEQCTTASTCEEANVSSPSSNPGQFEFGQPRAVAVDSDGNVYAAEPEGNNRAQKFASTGNPVAFAAAELNGFPGPEDIVVDPTTDHVFAIKKDPSSSERRVLEFTAGGAFVDTHASGTTISFANGLAVVQGTTNFYLSSNPDPTYRGVFFLGTKVDPTASVEAPSPLTAHSATIQGKVNPQGFETAYRFEFSRDEGSSWEKLPSPDQSLGNGTSEIPVSQEVSGLIGGHQYRYKIVATKPFGAGSATTFQETFTTPASAPQVEAFSSAVTTKSAVLNALINPNNQATTYHFEYGSADCASNPCTSVPVPDAGIGSGETPVSVAKEIEGLTPGTTYHFRVLATNATDTTEGPDTTFTTFAPLTPNTNCPNQAFRVGPSANLPDCRAYEMVSPVDKNGGNAAIVGVYPNSQGDRSSSDGRKFAYGSTSGFGSIESSVAIKQYIAARGAQGWSTQAISPPFRTGLTGSNDELTTSRNWFQHFTDDLASTWLLSPSKVPLVAGASDQYANLYRRDNLSGAYELLSNTELFGPSNGFQSNGLALGLTGATDDGTSVTFRTRTALTPDSLADTRPKVYLYTDGEVHLVSILPDGTPDPADATVGSNRATLLSFKVVDNGTMAANNVISEDGSRIFWISAPDEFTDVVTVYVRLNPAEEQSALVGGECTEAAKACTVQLSPGNQSHFLTAATDGSKALLVTEGDLEVVDVASGASTTVAGELPNVSIGANGAARGFLGASEDLSRIYFVSKEALAPGATAAQPNLYLDQEGTKTFIATLSAFDSGEAMGDAIQPVSEVPRQRSSRVTPDGRRIAFTSTASLTGYDNTDALRDDYVNQGDMEVYVYDAVSDELDCVSCNPSGARPQGDALRKPFTGTFDEHVFFDGEIGAAAWLTTSTSGLSTPNALSDDGSRLFFQAYDALVPQDTNGIQDVYQWEAPGTGDCEVGGSAYSAMNGGCVSLISTGTSNQKSEFVDASPDGSSVFIRTASSIDPRDPNSIDIYVARVNGGFPLPPEAPDCFGDACQSVPPAPDDPTPASAGFRGAGDPAPIPDCGATAKRAAKLGRLATRLRRAAKHAETPSQSAALRKRAERHAKQAKRLSNNAKRCRRANRRAAR
jgi:NHL repeat